MGYVVRVVIDAPVDTVWKAWTSSDEAQKWLAPRANITFAPGGVYEFFWDEDPAIDSTLGCKLLDIVPGLALAFEWQGKKEFLHMFQPTTGGCTVVEVTLIKTTAGVEIIVEQEETRTLPDWKAYDSWMAAAWEMALGSLKSYCEGESVRPYWEQ